MVSPEATCQSTVSWDTHNALDLVCLRIEPEKREGRGLWNVDVETIIKDSSITLCYMLQASSREHRDDDDDDV